MGKEPPFFKVYFWIHSLKKQIPCVMEPVAPHTQKAFPQAWEPHLNDGLSLFCLTLDCSRLLGK